MTTDERRLTTMPAPTDGQIFMAKIIAMTIRNEMESMHGGGIDDPETGLTDAQMRRINPIIRNGALSALHAILSDAPGSDQFVWFQNLLIPDYWEEPEFTESYLDTLGSHVEVTVSGYTFETTFLQEDSGWEPVAERRVGKGTQMVYHLRRNEAKALLASLESNEADWPDARHRRDIERMRKVLAEDSE